MKKELPVGSLDGAVGGIENPVSGVPFEKAMEIAKSLGSGEDKGLYKTMSGKDYMKWWKGSNYEEYLKHSVEVDEYVSS